MRTRQFSALVRLMPPLHNRQNAQQLALECNALANEIDSGIQRFGIVHHGATGVKVYAQVVDGFGNQCVPPFPPLSPTSSPHLCQLLIPISLFADDANLPSLLGLAFIGYVDASDSVYQATRKFVLNNETNPFYYGSSDIGSPGIGGIGSEDASGNAGLGHVWALSLAARLLTIPRKGGSAAADAEAAWTLRALKESSGGTGLMHESFWYTDSSVFTRSWFAMANSFLGEALLTVLEEKPEWLLK